MDENLPVLLTFSITENEIKCDSIKESCSEYTIEDLTQKGNLLAKLYTQIYEKLSKNNNTFFAVISKLKAEISNEITRFQRKADFFKDRNTSKAEAFVSEIKVLHKLLKMLEPNSIA